MIQAKSIQVKRENGNNAGLTVSVYECELIDCKLGKVGFTLDIEQAKVFVENLQWAISEAEKYND